MPRLNLVYVREYPEQLGAETVFYERIKAILVVGNAGQVMRECLGPTP